MSLGQSLQQRQLQRLSPQQIQLMKLLQIPTAQIEQRIKEELEENPALEMNADLLEGDMEKSVEEMKDDLLDGSMEEEEAIPVDEFEMSNEELSNYDFDDDGEIANYKTPIKNLYLTGAGTHPGGSISGMPGRNCAKVFLKDQGSFWGKLNKF